MKRIALICVVIFLFLIGCSEKAEEKPLLEGISFNADITYYNEKYVAKGSVDKDGLLTLEILEPSELSGMVFYVNDSDTKVEYKGLSFSPNENSLLTSASNILYSGFSALQGEDAKLKCDDKTYTATAKDGGGEFIMEYSPTGLPLKLKYLSSAFEANFYDLEILKNE